ncbi:aldehyde dehydrogenase family protein [Paenalkalicoccus suaedae]|uniref:3-sulfolactaldehyde dehydrogenase n=1 Tax=Paenalkalicoccus suaedae TaxID=2592382 RepID=A0A859FJ34_9BACI|nr:aldehyde dehydrogenase family protein [Paenalkalicoccus suaedae]QKS72436.1 aldehyde dehydrogenase family protein [Paenalkalicoccus suaedae]
MSTFAMQFIDGKWVDGKSEKELSNYNPYTNEHLFTMYSASDEDVDAAYKAAKRAQKEWGQTLPSERAELLNEVAKIVEKRKDEIIDWLVKESGSSITKATIEFGAALNIIKESSSFPYRTKGQIMESDFPGKENRVYRSAKGVIGVIGPWNFPFHLSMRSVAPAIATGNTVVLKPASETIVTAGSLIADIFSEAGAPDGVINMVAGRGSEIGDAFVEHPIPKVISFTGSTEVGAHIAELAGKHLKETALELGGNNAFIVLEDADLDQAVDSAIFGKFLHQGQICMSTNRFLVDERIYDDFIDKFVERVEGLKSGDPTEKETVIGPIINKDQIERMEKDLDETVKAGAKVLTGGKAEGLVFLPTVVRDVTNDMPLAKNEIFGPIAPIIPFSTEEEAIDIANDSPYGLSGAIHSKDIHRATELAKQVETGMIHVNDQTVNDESHAAFGGEKASGLGRFGGEWALDKFTTEKWVSVQGVRREYPF